MGDRLLLGIDVGTTSIKVAVIDENAKLIGLSSSSYRMITPNQDYAQIDSADMWMSFVKVCGFL